MAITPKKPILLSTKVQKALPGRSRVRPSLSQSPNDAFTGLATQGPGTDILALDEALTKFSHERPQIAEEL